MQTFHWLGIAGALMFSVAAWAADAGSFAGRWAGTMTLPNGVEVHVDMVLDGEAGTWRMAMPEQKARARQNPCMERDLPVVVVSRSDTELQLDVHGASVIKGCIDNRATLTAADGGSLKGRLNDGRTLVFARR